MVTDRRLNERVRRSFKNKMATFIARTVAPSSTILTVAQRPVLALLYPALLSSQCLVVGLAHGGQILHSADGLLSFRGWWWRFTTDAILVKLDLAPLGHAGQRVGPEGALLHPGLEVATAAGPTAQAAPASQIGRALMRNAKTADGWCQWRHNVTGAKRGGHLAGSSLLRGAATAARRLLVELLQQPAVKLQLGGPLLLPQLLVVTELWPVAHDGCRLAVMLLVGEHVRSHGVGELAVEVVAGLVLPHMVDLLCQGVYIYKDLSHTSFSLN